MRPLPVSDSAPCLGGMARRAVRAPRPRLPFDAIGAPSASGAGMLPQCRAGAPAKTARCTLVVHAENTARSPCARQLRGRDRWKLARRGPDLFVVLGRLVRDPELL